MNNRLLALLWGMLVAGGYLLVAGIPRALDRDDDAFAANRILGRGINLGNGLDGPREGEWGLTLRADYFQLIREAGFDAVRIPIRWSTHARKEPPYTIDPDFFERVDWAIDQALSQKLAAVINVHHYEEMFQDPDKHLPRLLSLWRQIAARYRNQPEGLFFEILNEPTDKLTDERWQHMIAPLLAAIRESNPRRLVIIGPGFWNNLEHLDKLHLPVQDRRLIVTIHYYTPFKFTHQAAPWIKDSAPWKGRTWKGTPEEREKLHKDFEIAAIWAMQRRRPLYLGEFGAYMAGDMDSRARWTGAVAREAEQLGMSWAYWEFGSYFSAYNRDQHAWRQPLLDALVKSKASKDK